MRWRMASAMSRAMKTRIAVVSPQLSVRKRSAMPKLLGNDDERTASHHFPSYHVEGLLRGEPANAVAVSGKLAFDHFGLFFAGQSVEYQPHRFFRSASARAGHSSDAN